MIKTNNNKQQKEQVKRGISAVLNQLAQLSSHPDRPGDTGPALISKDPSHNTANDNDGMLGSIMLEGIFAASFSEATGDILNTDMPNIDFGAAADCYGEFANDRIVGKGTYARTAQATNNSLKLAFHETAWDRYFNTLPKRRQIESTLARLTEELNILHAADTPAPRMFA